MKIQNRVVVFIVLAAFSIIPLLSSAQISSVGKGVQIEYSNGVKDSLYVFCGEKGEKNASLTATAPNGESGSFEWQKYNSGDFQFFSSESGHTSTIPGLENGCYRVSFTSASGVTTDTAWVFNNYIETTAIDTLSDCYSFTLKGKFDPTAIKYIDLPTGNEKELDKEIVYKWLDGSTLINRTIYDPPTQDTDYTFQVTDRFGCVYESTVRYNSIVTKASFTYTLEDPNSHPKKKEAPLTVTFSNTSENGDAGKYQWFIFKDRSAIIREAEANPGEIIDSIMVIMTNDNPVYVFERPGDYLVKLISQKKSDFTICFDTVYIDDYIKIDTSFIEAPNFFTPDGIGENEKFVVRFFSMKSVKISIFNRWGKVVHVYENNNVQGFGQTVESVPQAVWDGKIGSKMATPGVYYYVVEGIGRDDRRQRTNGFVHLFRGK